MCMQMVNNTMSRAYIHFFLRFLKKNAMNIFDPWQIFIVHTKEMNGIHDMLVNE